MFSKKLPMAMKKKKVFVNFLKKMSGFWQFLTVKWQFSEGPELDLHSSFSLQNQISFWGSRVF